MTPQRLSVVVPVHNEREHIAETVEAAVAAILAAPSFTAEIVIVDDGSTDDSAEIARGACRDRVPLRLVSQENRGRFEARRTGLLEASGDWVLFLDARATLAPEALAFVARKLERGERVWTGHVDVATGGNPFAVFWKLLAELAWEEYFREPRTTSYDAASFDRFPKGTTCFLAPRELLVGATEAFRSGYLDLRHANDDTPVIRWIATRERIHISPRFSCTYGPRRSARAFVRHSVHRGVVFVDGHGTPASRFFPVVVAFYPCSAALAVAALRKPVLVPLAAVSTGVAAGLFAAARGRTAHETASLAAVAPLYAAAHGLGMWRGLGLQLRARLARRASA
jgi:glycosyltransferase involved in cell wall biosynthesis